MDDNAQQSSTGGDTNMGFDSKNIKRVDNKKLFTNVKQPTKRKSFRARVADFFEPIGDFFKGIFNFFKDHRFARIALIILIIAIPLGVWVLVKTVFPGDIVIGDIRITRQEINTYADELDRYKELNPEVILEDAEQFATDQLIENAAFRHYAQNDCADIDVDLSHITAGQNSFYLRIPAENSAYRAQLEPCLIADKSVFSVMIGFDTPYFAGMDLSGQETAFAAAKQRMNDEFLPLFEQGLSIEEIAAKVDIDYINADIYNMPNDLWYTQAVATAALDTCQGDASECFNDVMDVSYDANPGQLFTMAEKIQSLKEVGDHTDVFASRIGNFAILRLEDKSGGLFNSYEEMLEHIKDTYVKKNFFARLFASTIERVFISEDTYASDTNVNWIDNARTTKTGDVECGGHVINFFIRAQTTTGLPLGTFEFHIKQSGNNCIKENIDGYYGPGGGFAPLLQYTTNCMGSGTNFTTPPAGATLDPNDGILVKHPKGYTEAKHLVMRASNDGSVDLINPPDSIKNKAIPWTQKYINERGLDGNGLVIVYESIPIEATFSAQSFVSIGVSQSPFAESPINGSAVVTSPTTISVVNGTAPKVIVSFDHAINYSGPTPISDYIPPNCTATTSDPCTLWTVEPFGDVIADLGEDTTNIILAAASDPGGTTSANDILNDPQNIEIRPGVFQLIMHRVEKKEYTLPVPAPGTYQDVKICQRIAFNFGQWLPVEGTYNFARVFGSDNSSDACAVFRVDNGGPSTSGGGPGSPTSCPIPGDLTGPDRGNTRARSGVINLSHSAGAWKYTSDASSTEFVWAKPGDSIRFSHTLCFGAQAVRGSSDPAPGVPEFPPPEYRPPNPRETTPPFIYRTRLPSHFNPGAVNTFEVQASTIEPSDGASNGNYLFGKSLANPTGQIFSRTLTAGQARPLNGIADVSNDYNFTFYSPSENAGDTFRCYDSERGLPTFRTNGYQIPGFKTENVPANCGPYTTNPKVSPTASDAGKTIEQKLTWRNVQAWINTSSGPPQGSCGCSSTRNTQKRALSSVTDTPIAGFNAGFHRYDCYARGECCNEDDCVTQYHDLYSYWYYPMTVPAIAAGPPQTVQVKIPYNYTTSPTVTMPQLPVVYGGGDVSVSVSVKINERPNNEVSTTPYATLSKPSVYEVVVFTVAPNTNYNQIGHEISNYSGGSNISACATGGHFRQGATDCKVIERNDLANSKIFNPKGFLQDVPSDNIFNQKITVPDLEVGTKFCVAIGVWPSDSHDHTTGPAGTGDIALKNNGNTWHYSEPTCRTIAKKPTIQFQSSGVYTDGFITTSQTKKSVDYKLGTNGTPPLSTKVDASDSGFLSNSEKDGQRRVFGSWSEYEAIAQNPITGFASGAAFGYDRNNGGNLNISRSSNPSNYFRVGHNDDPELCTYSTQTFSNSHCAQKVVGYSTINSMGATVLDRLIARYTLPTAEPTQSPGTRLDFVGLCTLDTDGVFNPPQDGLSYICLDNGAKYMKINGDAYTQNITPNVSSAWWCISKGDTINSRTIVIHVSGTLTIDTDFIYGNPPGGCSATTYDTYGSIAELPQLIVIAGDINITSRVTRLDAWLIAGQAGTGSGIINTCVAVNTSAAGSFSNIAFDSLNSGTCNQPLVFNGPVFANKLTLNRTAGAGTGPASILPAETFNLRPDSYLWAYNQAQRFSQAVTTYSRELAPRY